MEPVVTINLSGNAYQLEVRAHEALKAYLERAGATLVDNPDKTEILRDLEQAVADKASACLSAHKNVVTGADMDAILTELGPVESDEAGAESAQAHAERNDTGAPKKKLYRIREGAMISGVCSGIGAYFALDANVVRFLFIIAALLTSGVSIILYVVLMFVMPPANTSAEWAAAHGLPSTAQEVIDQVKRETKRKFEEFTDPENPPPFWGKHWRREARRAWRAEMRTRMRSQARNWAHAAPPGPTNPPSLPGQIIGGLLALILGLISLALFIAFIATLYGLVTGVAVLGFITLPAMPLWLAILLVCAVFALISMPLRALRHAAVSIATGYPRYYYHDHGGGLMPLLFFAFVFWMSYQHIPEFHAWADGAWIQFKSWLDSLPVVRIDI